METCIDQNISRKQHCVSLILPEIIRRENGIYKYLKVEQEGERIHKRLNDLVRKFNKKGKKEDMLFQMIELVEVQNKMDNSRKKPIKRNFKKKTQ